MEILGKGRSKKKWNQTPLIGLLRQNAMRCSSKGNPGPCTSQQGLLRENCQPGAVMLLLKTQAKPGKDESLRGRIVRESGKSVVLDSDTSVLESWFLGGLSQVM